MMCIVALVYLFPLFSNSESLLPVMTMVCNNLDLIRVVLWTRLRLSFNAYVDPLYEFQVIYQALTRQLTTG
jgi:hypothetical protein